MIKQVIIKRELLEHFKQIGIKPGMVLLVQCDLTAIGYVVGGAQTIIDALIDVVGYEGTIVMPMFNFENSEPSYWHNPAIEHNLMQDVRDNMPAFQAKDSDCYDMGAVVNSFRRRDGVVFSKHPTYAFVAWGKYAKLICDRHSLHFPLGEESPLAKISELRGATLLMGKDYSQAIMFHLAEDRSGIRPIILNGGGVEITQGRTWKKYLDIDKQPLSFFEIGKLLEDRKLVTKLPLGHSESLLIPFTGAMKCADQYFKELFNS